MTDSEKVVICPRCGIGVEIDDIILKSKKEAVKEYIGKLVVKYGGKGEIH